MPISDQKKFVFRIYKPLLQTAHIKKGQGLKKRPFTKEDVQIQQDLNNIHLKNANLISSYY